MLLSKELRQCKRVFPLIFKVNENQSLDAHNFDAGDLRRSASAGQLRTGNEGISASNLHAENLSESNLYPGMGNASRPIIIVQPCCGGHGSSRCGHGSSRSCHSEVSGSENRKHLHPEKTRKHKSSRKKSRQVISGLCLLKCSTLVKATGIVFTTLHIFRNL